jgi:hypothetical protein
LQKRPKDEKLEEIVLDSLEKNLDYVCKAHTWATFQDSMSSIGCIFELFLRSAEAITSPSVQVVIDEDFNVVILSTHEQELDGQVYLGGQFPVTKPYSKDIIEYSKCIGLKLASLGIQDHFSVDFLAVLRDNVWEVNAIEINLRLTGTTHPFMAMHLLCDGEFSEHSGKYIIADGDSRSYIASDHVEHESLKSILPVDLLEFSQTVPELKWDPEKKKGVVFHLLGLTSQTGEIGMTAIGGDVQEARSIFANAKEKLIKLATNEPFCDKQEIKFT